MKTNHDDSQPRSFTRRKFLRTAAAVGTGISIVPRHVLGGAGNVPPSEKLNIAGIGIGGQGRADLEELKNQNIVALCDVDWEYAAPVFNRYPAAKRYKDFREMLDKEKSIDAVVVATPDHIHAVASMTAIKHGKHVYCEKPLTRTVTEARRLAEPAKEAKVATQRGNQGGGFEGNRLIKEWIWGGVIGPVREVHVWSDRPTHRGKAPLWCPQGIDRPTDTPPVPATLDWDLWLGPAPARPYHPAYLPFKWRGWWDFGSGALGDIGCHAFDAGFRALQLAHPRVVRASPARVNKKPYPVAAMVTYEFPARGEMPPVKLIWYDGGLRPPR